MNRITKKNFRPVTALFILAAFITASFITPRVIPADFGDITKKNYYSKLFTAKEIKKLSKARSGITDAQQELKEAENLFRKAETFNRLKNNARDAKDKKRAGKKEQKYLKKAYRAGFSAYKDYFKNMEFIYYTYDQRLRKFNPDSSNYHRFAQDYTDKSRNLYTGSIALKRSAENKKEQDRYDDLEKAAASAKEAVEKQETALMLFQKDKTLELPKLRDKKEKQNEVVDNETNKTNDQTNKTKTDSIHTDSTHTVVYNPEEDPNVYKSIRDSIYGKLNLSQADSALFKKAMAKKSRADIHMEAVNVRYKRIDTLLNKIYHEVDRVKKNMLKQDAEELEKDVFKDLIAAANLYIETNEILFEIYEKNFPKARPADNAGNLSKGRAFEENAKELKLMAKSNIVNANLQMYASEKYLQLMNSIQLQLSALQQQENAYAVYYGWPVTPLKKAFKNRYYADTDNDAKNGRDPEKSNDPQGDSDTEETDNSTTTEFNYAGTYFYTKQNPKPQVYKPVSGTVFKVQVGIFKRLLSLNTFGDFSPISYDIFKNNPYKRFMVGEYKSKEAAEYALTTIKKMGIDDAFIVAYTNGRRQSFEKASENVTADAKYKKEAQKEVENLKQNSRKTHSGTLSYPDFISYGSGPDDFARGIDISGVSGLNYTVQVGMYKMPKTNAELKHISPLYREVTPQGIKYLSGLFPTYEKAKVHESEMQKVGFAKAFVSAYFNGENISLSDAKTVTNTKENKVMQPNVYFSVQIGAYSSLLPPEKEAQFNDISKKHTISVKSGPKGLVIYTVGQFLRYEQAKALSRELKPEYPDVFVVAFKNEKKIPVAEAIKLTEK